MPLIFHAGPLGSNFGDPQGRQEAHQRRLIDQTQLFQEADREKDRELVRWQQGERFRLIEEEVQRAQQANQAAGSGLLEMQQAVGDAEDPEEQAFQSVLQRVQERGGTAETMAALQGQWQQLRAYRQEQQMRQRVAEGYQRMVTYRPDWGPVLQPFAEAAMAGGDVTTIASRAMQELREYEKQRTEEQSRMQRFAMSSSMLDDLTNPTSPFRQRIELMDDDGTVMPKLLESAFQSMMRNAIGPAVMPWDQARAGAPTPGRGRLEGAGSGAPQVGPSGAAPGYSGPGQMDLEGPLAKAINRERAESAKQAKTERAQQRRPWSKEDPTTRAQVVMSLVEQIQAGLQRGGDARESIAAVLREAAEKSPYFEPGDVVAVQRELAADLMAALQMIQDGERPTAKRLEELYGVTARKGMQAAPPRGPKY